MSEPPYALQLFMQTIGILKRKETDEPASRPKQKTQPTKPDEWWKRGEECPF